MKHLLASLVIFVAACGPATSPTTAPSSAETTPPTDGAPATTAPAPTTSVLPSVTATTPVALAAVFLAVVEEALEGTDLAAFPDEDPDAVLAAGQLFCELRDEGLTDEEALEAYLGTLAGTREVVESDAVFAGAVFGAAEQTLCPPSR